MGLDPDACVPGGGQRLLRGLALEPGVGVGSAMAKHDLGDPIGPAAQRGGDQPPCVVQLFTVARGGAPPRPDG